jgi:restriction endonuclease S subunit
MNEYFRQNILLPDKHKQQEIVNMIVSIQSKAKQLQQEATEVLEEAKKGVEGMIEGKNVTNR